MAASRSGPLRSAGAPTYAEPWRQQYDLGFGQRHGAAEHIDHRYAEHRQRPQLGRAGGHYLGYNYRLGSNWIVGAQVEGTVANNFVQLDANQISLSNRTTVTTPLGGVGATTTSQTVTTVGFVDALAERWAVSALLRAGWLIDPRDLIYVIGGYTYGGFEWGTRTFGLNGATIGGGWEHQIAPAWTLRAEYRYTRFEDKDFVRSTSSTINQTNVSAAGPPARPRARARPPARIGWRASTCTRSASGSPITSAATRPLLLCPFPRW